MYVYMQERIVSLSIIIANVYSQLCACVRHSEASHDGELSGARAGCCGETLRDPGCEIQVSLSQLATGIYVCISCGVYLPSYPFGPISLFSLALS
jgi:hypothetical protein